MVILYNRVPEEAMEEVVDDAVLNAILSQFNAVSTLF